MFRYIYDTKKTVKDWTCVGLVFAYTQACMCVCVIHVNHSPHNYHFLVNGSDLLITILPRVHATCLSVQRRESKTKGEKEKERMRQQR